MWPTIVEVQTDSGPFGIHPYGLFLVLAFSAAFLLIHVRAQRVGINPDRLIGGYVAAAIGGIVGGHVLYALAVEPERIASALFSLSGFAVYGGIIGGIVGVAFFVWMSNLDPWKIADLAAPAVVLGMGVGRIGCWMAGCCHGAEASIEAGAAPLLQGLFPGGHLLLSSDGPFLTNVFYAGAGNVTRADLLDRPLYPTQIWSLVSLLILSGVLAWAWTKRRYDGQIAALTLLVEPPFRILFESYRADTRGYVVSWPVSEAVAARLPPGFSQAAADAADMGARVGITTSQGIGLAFMLGGVVIWAIRRRTTREADRPVRPTEGDLLEELT